MNQEITSINVAYGKLIKEINNVHGQLRVIKQGTKKYQDKYTELRKLKQEKRKFIPKKELEAFKKRREAEKQEAVRYQQEKNNYYEISEVVLPSSTLLASGIITKCQYSRSLRYKLIVQLPSTIVKGVRVPGKVKVTTNYFQIAGRYKHSDLNKFLQTQSS